MIDRLCDAATILVIDDDDSTAANLRDALIDLGYGVRRAASAKEALVAVEAAPVDLILLDLHLADTDGLMLCSRLRKRTSASLLVMSARPRQVDRLLALEMGASGLVTKPVDCDDLEAALSEAAVVDRREFQQVAAAW